MNKDEAISFLTKVGFEIEENIIHMSDELPVMNISVQVAINVLCRDHDYECEFRN